MKFRTTLLIIGFILITTLAFGQDLVQTEKQDFERRHSIGSTLFLVGNFAPGDPPNFYQLNYGYRLNQKSNIVVEAITWTVYEPIGTYESSDELYPGKLRSYGIGIGYQRFWWKNSYSTVQATPFLLQFIDSENEEIQKGFQLYLQMRLGYRFEFFQNSWFLEPSIAFNYWPIYTNFPTDFEEVEDGAPNYFLFEPGLHFGYQF